MKLVYIFLFKKSDNISNIIKLKIYTELKQKCVKLTKKTYIYGFNLNFVKLVRLVCLAAFTVNVIPL